MVRKLFILFLVILLSINSYADETVSCRIGFQTIATINCIDSTSAFSYDVTSNEVSNSAYRDPSLRKLIWLDENYKSGEVSFSNLQTPQTIRFNLMMNGEEITFSEFNPDCQCTIHPIATLEDRTPPIVEVSTLPDRIEKNTQFSFTVTASDDSGITGIKVYYDYKTDKESFVTQSCISEVQTCTKTFNFGGYSKEGVYSIAVVVSDASSSLNEAIKENNIEVYTQYYYCDKDGDGYYADEQLDTVPVSGGIVSPVGIDCVKVESLPSEYSFDCDDSSTKCNVDCESVLYEDLDRDGEGNPNILYPKCKATTGFVSNTKDCDDNTALFNSTVSWYYDKDKDNYYSKTAKCAPIDYNPNYNIYDQLVGWYANSHNKGLDCDDSDADINPGKKEHCSNGIDDNCNKLVDMSDSFCSTEVCNGKDDDGDGLIDEGCDSDQDGYIDEDMKAGCVSSAKCAGDNGIVTNGLICKGCNLLDCNDDPVKQGKLYNPGIPEACGSEHDYNCDGLSYENRVDPCVSDYADGICKIPLTSSTSEQLFCYGKVVDIGNGYMGCDCVPFLSVKGLESGEEYEGAIKFTAETNVFGSDGKPAIYYSKNLIAGTETPLKTRIVNSNVEISWFATDARELEFKEYKFHVFLGSSNPSINGRVYDEFATIKYMPREPVDYKATQTVETQTTSEAEKQKMSEDYDFDYEEVETDSLSYDTTAGYTNEGQTIVTTAVSAGKDKKIDTTIFVEIPKCAAELVSEMQFGSNDYQVIEEDPLIAWHFTGVTAETLDISYSFGKELDPECLEQIKVSDFITNVEDYSTNNSAPLFLLAIPLVVVIIIGLTKFTTTESRFEISIDQRRMIKELEEIIENRIRDGEDHEFILSELKQEGFDRDHIKEAFRRKGLL